MPRWRELRLAEGRATATSPITSPEGNRPPSICAQHRTDALIQRRSRDLRAGTGMRRAGPFLVLANGVRRPLGSEAADRVPVPFDAEARLVGRNGTSILDGHARMGDAIKLGMYSIQRPLGTAADSETCSSIRKCGQMATLKLSARCATLSQG